MIGAMIKRIFRLRRRYITIFLCFTFSVFLVTVWNFGANQDNILTNERGKTRRSVDGDIQSLNSINESFYSEREVPGDAVQAPFTDAEEKIRRHQIIINHSEIWPIGSLPVENEMPASHSPSIDMGPANVVPIEPTEPAEPTEPTEPAQSDEMTEPTQPAETTEMKRINIVLESASENGNEADFLQVGRPHAFNPMMTKIPKSATRDGQNNPSVAEEALQTTTPAIHVEQRKGSSADADQAELVLSEIEVEKLRLKVEEINRKQEISNLDIYGPVLNNTLIILIQVHNRLQHLEQLILSLGRARHIEECLVIFSHDLWSPETNKLVASISAFRAMQIFFPFSMQLYPHAFPGLDPRDCKKEHIPEKRDSNFNRTSSCLNENWPDSFKHYREPHLTQLKHHWWWKANKVFDDLRVTRNFTSDVLFLEEDHYVAHDIIHTLRLLRTMADKKHANILSAGNKLKEDPSVAKDLAFTGDWGSNLGFAFNINTWKMIKAEADFFCTYDEYNWDCTLSALLQSRLPLKDVTLSALLSRVHHVGLSCGTHWHMKPFCDASDDIITATRQITMAEPYLFPAKLRLMPAKKNTSYLWKKSKGGWGDPRDWQLCIAMANGTASEETLAALQLPGVVY